MHSEGGRLRSASEHAELVGALRAAADAAGVHVVINARTDLFIRQDGDESDRVDRAIARLTEAAGSRRRRPVSRGAPRPGYVAALDLRAAVAGQRHRAAGSGRPGVLRPAGGGADQLRPVPAGRSQAREGDPGSLGLHSGVWHPTHDPEHWSNRPNIFARAAVLLVGVLIFAVMQTSDDRRNRQVIPPMSSRRRARRTTRFYTPPRPNCRPRSRHRPSRLHDQDRNCHRNGDFDAASAVITEFGGIVT